MLEFFKNHFDKLVVVTLIVTIFFFADHWFHANNNDAFQLASTSINNLTGALIALLTGRAAQREKDKRDDKETESSVPAATP